MSEINGDSELLYKVIFMKKFATFLVSSLIVLSSALLTAQSYPNDGYFYPNGNPQFNPSNQITWLRNYEEAVSKSQSSSKPIVVLFTGTTWCPACIKLEREVLSHPEFVNGVGQKFIFLKAEFPDYTESALMSSPYKPLLDRYGVDAYPTIVVINANGQKLFTVNYQIGGPGIYVRELLQKLNSMNTAAPAPSSNDGYYR